MIRAPYIYYEENRLKVERVLVEDIISEIGSPAYIYSKTSFIGQLNQLKSAFKEYSTIICYSVKVNHNINVIKTFGDAGCGCDIVSGGELYRALKAGINPKKIVYSGVAKTVKEIREAIESEILMLNVESEQEIERINQVGSSLRRKVPIAIRINPGVDAKTHPYITTGMKENKFGIDSDKVLDLFRLAKSMSNIEVCGIDVHIGSQLLDVKPFGEAMEIVAGYVKQLREEAINIKYVDVGGGLGISYQDYQMQIELKEYCYAITEPFKHLPGITFILEPGRFLTAQAGILAAKIQYVKNNTFGKRFVIVDTGMHHMIRPALYGASHNIIPIHNISGEKIKSDVVGPICESTDFLAKDYLMEEVGQDDLIAITDTGAYGMVLASHYNSHSLPAEVLVDGAKFKVIRKVETYEDLIRQELQESPQRGVKHPSDGKGQGMGRKSEMEGAMMNIIIKDIKEFSCEDLRELFLSVKWSSGQYPEKLKIAMQNSHSVYSAWDDDKLIGLINAMSDGIINVYFQYLLVNPEYQGKGIGKQLVSLMLKQYREYLRKTLIAYGDAEGFYKSCGFKTGEGLLPMSITTLST